MGPGRHYVPFDLDMALPSSPLNPHVMRHGNHRPHASFEAVRFLEPY